MGRSAGRVDHEVRIVLRLLAFWSVISHVRDPVCSSSPVLGDSTEPAGHTEFPFVVSIGYVFEDDNQKHFCTGSLISKKHVLTAAHCVYNETEDLLEVSIGSNDRIEALKFFVVEIVTYSDWYERKNCAAATLAFYDVAILKLDEEVFDPAVKLPKLSYVDDTVYDDKTVTLAGWGMIGGLNSLQTYPRFLQKADMQVISRQNCKTYMESLEDKKVVIEIPETFICTTSNPRILIGYGDSGGPLISGKNDVIGVASAVYPKRLKNSYDAQNVFISTEKVQDFITDVLLH